MNDEGLIKDDNKRSSLNAESADGICETEKKLLQEVFLKAKHLIPLYFSDDQREAYVEENDFMIVTSRGKRCAC